MNYFEIENLKCSYNQKESVLEIENLVIPRGKVVFIVGESGCGKSTILETLGLMNDTIYAPDEKTRFMFRPDADTSIDCLQIWHAKGAKLSNVRKCYFSFIFQQTNLMKNFSIWENANLPRLIKAENHHPQSKKYRDILAQVGLGQILDENKQNVNELSGGQQQRLAFVRAFMPDFHILFGDEPTGNLDPDNADKLMRLIATEIHKSNNKTAIIVSHTPELYTRYADLIISIQKRTHANGNHYGYINTASATTNQPSYLKDAKQE